MYGVSVQVTVKALSRTGEYQRVVGTDETPTTVDGFSFSRTDNTTFVRITNSGFRGRWGCDREAGVDSTEGLHSCSLG